MINQLQGRELTRLKPSLRCSSVGINPCWDDENSHMGARKTPGYWQFLPGCTDTVSSMAVGLRSTEIPVCPHHTCLLQGLWAHRSGTDPAGKGSSQLPSTSQSSSFTYPPVPRCKLCFPLRAPRGVASWGRDNDLSPVWRVLSRAVTLSVTSQALPSPDSRQKCLAGFAQWPWHWQFLPALIQYQTSSWFHAAVRSYFTNSVVINENEAGDAEDSPLQGHHPANNSSSKGTCHPQEWQVSAAALHQSEFEAGGIIWDTLVSQSQHITLPVREGENETLVKHSEVK